MKVLMINGSPRADGNTARALAEMEMVFRESGVECETVLVGDKDIRGCIACRSCEEAKRCVFDDIVNVLADKLKESDGLVIGSPVYYAQANATLTALLQRMFFSMRTDLRYKVGAGVVVARRGGSATAYDDLNKYFGVAGMPIATSQYWNMVYGRNIGEADEDAEGLQTMRSLANNMVFLMRSIALGKEQFGLPEAEEEIATNFVR